jgi:hypothetical protein
MDYSRPQQIGINDSYSHVAIGDSCTYAVKTDGTLWCWGKNSTGLRLGIEENWYTPNNQNIVDPAQVNGGGSNWVKSAICGDYARVFLKSDGTMWGIGNLKNLGMGYPTDSTAKVSSPVQIGGGQTGWTDIIAYNDKDLINDTEFWSQHSNFIQNNSRGYGYWVWKSYIIKKTMDTLNNDDILLYLDCGCEININKKIIISEYFELVKKDYIIGTETFIEKNWTKMDLLLKLDMLDDKYLNTPQHQGGTVLFKICDKTRTLVNQWYELSSDYHNIDDSPSISANFNCFVEHRHDQSIFSLLTKKYNLFSNKSLFDFIECDRNISGNTRIRN